MAEEADLSFRRGCGADLAAYWRGLRLFYDPRGRSSRTELAMLLVLPAIVGYGAVLLVSSTIGAEWSRWFDFAALTFLAIPLPAAAARRFHDMAKSGWLTLPLVGLILTGLWDAWLDASAANFAERNLWTNRSAQEAMFGLAWLAYGVALMLPPRDAKNPYGPNPRPAPKEI